MEKTDRKGLRRKLGYYARVFMALAKCSFMSQVEYRINYVSSLMIEISYAAAKLIYVAVIYQTGCRIGRLTPDHIAMFVGCYGLMTGIYMYFYRSYTAIPGYVKTGELDMYLTKPLSLRFFITFRKLDYAMPLPNVAVGITLILMGWRRTGIPVTAGTVTGFILFILLSTMTTLFFFLIPHILSFWLVGINGIVNLSADLWDFGNMPGQLYGGWIQKLGTFVLPIFLITNYPILFIMGELEGYMYVWAVAAPILAFAVSEALWRYAMKCYGSASS